MKFTAEQITAARQLAETIEPSQLDALFPVDWGRVNADKRKGAVHAWNWSARGRVYLGQYKTHATAFEYGANVTRFAGKWFLWSPKIMYAIQRDTIKSA